jgi:hypothetical protein
LESRRTGNHRLRITGSLRISPTAQRKPEEEFYMSIDTTNFASFDVSELAVLDVTDAIGLPEMGASIDLDYVPDIDDMIGDVASGASAGCSCSSTCCC